jgi:NAD(P)-dependent dehydrogenase (short-subunit alcohol dehydrogenase family)
LSGPHSGRVAIVTGGSGGIGSAVALELAAQGASVVVADVGCDGEGHGRSVEPAQSVANEISRRGGKAIAVCMDASDPSECHQLVEATLAEFSRLDVLCHVAGVLRQGLIFELDDADWNAIHDVHVAGAANCIYNCLPTMLRQRHGRIVLFSSRSVSGSPGHTFYSAAKAAVLSMGLSLSRQLQGTGISINVVLPSGRTRASAAAASNARELRIQLMRARAHRITDPERYRSSSEQDPENNAPMIAWLCSEAAGTTTGRIIGTGGWRVALYSPSTTTSVMPLPDEVTMEHLQTLVNGL